MKPETGLPVKAKKNPKKLRLNFTKKKPSYLSTPWTGNNHWEFVDKNNVKYYIDELYPESGPPLDKEPWIVMMADSNPDDKPTGQPKDPNKYEETETETEGDEESHPHKRTKREEPTKSPNILEDFDSEEDDKDESGIFDTAPLPIWYNFN